MIPKFHIPNSHRTSWPEVLKPTHNRLSVHFTKKGTGRDICTPMLQLSLLRISFLSLILIVLFHRIALPFVSPVLRTYSWVVRERRAAACRVAV